MIDEETNYIEINSEPFSGVVWEVVDHTTQSIGIGEIAVVTASEGTKDGSLITLKFLEGNDTVNVEEVNGTDEEDVSLEDINTLQ